MWQMILPILQSQPKFRNIIESTFHQPVEYVVNWFGSFVDSVAKGPGITNTKEKQLALFNRLYQGGLSLGFSDWEAEFAAAKLSGYSDMDICISFRERHHWPQTRIEDIPAIEANVMPRFMPKAKAAGLLPPEVFPESGLPQTDVSTSGGAAPWENLIRPGADGAGNSNAPK